MLKRLSEQDYYQILEVDCQATAVEIQSAYESARDIYSGESMVSSSILSPEERRQVLTLITTAYHTLVAAESRRLYDESLEVRAPGADAVSVTGFQTQKEGRTGREAASSKPKSYPRLVRGTAQPEGPAGKSRVQLGLKEEATGKFLRRARESCKLDLRSIARETKIGVTMLGYIEEERVDRLPAPVYLKNFVCQYARCLGLEDEKVARSYLGRIRRLKSQD